MFPNIINKLVNAQHLTRDEAAAAMEEIMAGGASEAQIASFLTGMRMKGETVPEITACCEVMRRKATAVPTGRSPLVDTCGTGGDCSGTFNISTTAAFIVAGAGLAVAKHGNRSVSSRCGSADLLEALGINIDLAPEAVGLCIDKIGIGFLFAPRFHQAMRYVVKPRREIGIRTIFNILGPLTNPAGARHQVIGVYDCALTEVIASTLLNLGVDHALVVHGMDGLDEISISAETKITEVHSGGIKTYYISPEELGIKRAPRQAVKGGSAKENADITLDILQGVPGACREVALLNAAGALYVGGMARSLKEGVAVAAEVIDSGRAYEKYTSLKELSWSLQAVGGGGMTR